MTRLAALVLAAGQGTRMRSRLPKVLHPVGGLPLVQHPVRAARALGCDPVVVVVDPNGGPIREAITDVAFAVQEKPRGTGDAARSGLTAVPDSFDGQVLILYGDVPLITKETLAQLVSAAPRGGLSVLTAVLNDATGYGRIVRDGSGKVQRIVEHKDASPAERDIREINAGIYVVDAALLRRGLAGLSSNNAQGELYLTDVVALAAKEAGAVAVKLDDPTEVRGVNNRAELAQAEQALQRRIIGAHQAAGVTVRDPLGTFIGIDVELEADVSLGVGVQIYGRSKISAGARVEGPTVIIDSHIGPEAVIEAFSHVEGASVGPLAHVGPFARLRPQASLGEGSRVGNFVELKKTKLGKGAKANHLAYLGDADVGEGANVGAGTITCNYDGGPVKHATRIGPGAFVGSNSTLVAPVQIGDGAYVAAGSTVTRDVPPNALAFGRARQENREGYAERLRDKIRVGATRSPKEKK